MTSLSLPINESAFADQFLRFADRIEPDASDHPMLHYAKRTEIQLRHDPADIGVGLALSVRDYYSTTRHDGALAVRHVARSRRTRGQRARADQRPSAAVVKLEALLPAMLQRGCPVATQTAVAFAREIASQPCVEALRAFIAGQHGSDELRLESHQILVEWNLLGDEPTRVYIEGEPQLTKTAVTVVRVVEESEETVGPGAADELPSAGEALQPAAEDAQVEEAADAEPGEPETNEQ